MADNNPNKEPWDFRVGDTVKVHYRITEGNKTRVQPYDGIVISKRGMGISKSFTVRKIGAAKIGVERIFPLYSPNIQKLEVLKHGKVRRAKLYYLREKKGREATKIKERKVKPVAKEKVVKVTRSAKSSSKSADSAKDSSK